MFFRAGASKNQEAAPTPRKLFQLKGSSVLAISRGDLTQWEGDAIVNAANKRMLGGGGVDGAIHMAAGPQLLDACYDVRPVAGSVRCPPGEARITPGFRLKAKFVIHTVGPVYQSARESAPLLRKAIKNSLLLCKENGIRSVAFPAISCGIYGYPPHKAAEVAIAAMLKFSEGIDLMEFVLFGKDTYEPFVEQAAEQLEAVDERKTTAKAAREESANPNLEPGGKEECTPDKALPEIRAASDERDTTRVGRKVARHDSHKSETSECDAALEEDNADEEEVIDPMSQQETELDPMSQQEQLSLDDDDQGPTVGGDEVTNAVLPDVAVTGQDAQKATKHDEPVASADGGDVPSAASGSAMETDGSGNEVTKTRDALAKDSDDDLTPSQADGVDRDRR